MSGYQTVSDIRCSSSETTVARGTNNTRAAVVIGDGDVCQSCKTRINCINTIVAADGRIIDIESLSLDSTANRCRVLDDE